MKKRFAALLLAICMMAAYVPAGAVELPSSLTEIEAEAFRGDSSMTGLLVLPGGVTRVGDHAFTGTGLYALRVPEAVTFVGAQDFRNAAYVRFDGAATQMGALSGVRCVLAPAGSPALTAASGADAVALDEVVTQDGFLYQAQGDALTLLCVEDPAAVGTSVTIPEEIGGKPVTAISGYAFIGCTSLAAISLPAAVEPSVTPGATADCPAAAISYYGDGGEEEPEEIIVRDVTADVTAGASGNSITWHVDAEAGEGASYTYTVEHNGSTVMTTEADEPVFVYEAGEAGAYRLFVTVTGRSGATATGASAVLYIAVEAMVMTVPESIEAGENLTIQVGEVENAQGYTLYVTNEQTGELVKKLTPAKAGDVSVDGYLLASGEYRVSGYVHGNDFRYTIPTVRNVTVTGTAADGPAIPAQEPLVVNNACMIDLDGDEAFVIRHQLRSADGTLTGYTHARSEASGAAGVYSYIYADGYQGGGTILVQASMQVDGKWTAWGPVTEITLNTKPVMAAPVITCPETVQAGADFTLSFTGVEGAAWYTLSFVSDATGESWAMNQYSSAQTLYISGATHNLPAGSYTVQVCATTSDYSNKATGTAKLTITGTRPAAPVVDTDIDVFYLGNTDMTVTVTAPGYDAASVGSGMYQSAALPPVVNGGYSVQQIALSNGTGSIKWGTSLGDFFDGWYYVCYAFVYVDGVWSEPGVVCVPISKPEPLDAAVITAPETLLTGEDLNFSFAAVEGAESYEAHLYSAAGVGSSTIKWFSDVQPGNVNTYPGYSLAAGVYCIRVTASSATLGSSTSDHYFTVSGTKPAAPTVTCDTDVAYAGGTVNFTVDAQDAQDVYCDWTGNGGSSGTVSGSGSSWRYNFQSSHSGKTMTFRFTVKRDGVWSQWATITFDVLAEKPVEPPTLTCPETILAGANLNVTISTVEVAARYQLYIYRGYTEGTIPTGSTNRVYSYSSSASPTILHGYDMNLEAGEYTVVAGAYVDGSWGYCAAKLTVTGARPAAPAVTVDKTSVLPSEKFTFSINTADAELVHCYGQDSSGSGSLDTLAVLEDVTVWQDYKSREEVFTYTFTTFRDGQWSQWSEPVVITVSNSLPGPEISVPASVALGCDVKVSVAETAAATRYSVNVRNSNGLQIIRQNADTLTDGGFLFEGYRFAPGTYTVEVEYYNGVGWSNVSEANFTVVNGTRPDAPAATADSDTGYIGVAIGFDVPVTGAQKAAVRYYRLGDPDDVTYKTLEVTADSLRWTDYKYTAGDTWNYAFAVQVDGVWSTWSTTLPVTISARQQLAAPAVTCPETVQAGTDVVFTFGAVQNADSYSVVLVRPDGSTRSWTGYPGNEMTLPGYDLNPGSYQLKITAGGAGYDSNTAVQAFTVTGTRADAPVVMVDKAAVFTGDTYTFVIENGDCGLIAWKYTTDAGGSNSGTLNALSDVTVWETSASWAGVQSYCFCTLHGGAWSAWSEPVAVTISQRPALSEPVVTLPETAQMGIDLNVAFEAVEGADYYYVDLYTIYGQSILSRHMQAAGNLTVPGCCLPESYVRVQVTAYGENGGVSKTSVTLRVVSATMPIAPAVTGPENGMVLGGNRAVFTVDTDGAQQAATRRYRVGDPNNVTITTFAVTGNTTEWKDYTRDVGSTWAYAFSVQVDGVWSAWSEELRVETVEELPEPELPAPVVTAPTALRHGEDLVFCFQPVPDAVDYNFTIRRPDGTIDTIRYVVEYPGEENRVYGFELQPGENTLIVAASFADGRRTVTEKIFTVSSDPLPAAPTVTVNKTIFAYGEYPIFTIDTAGADMIYVFFGATTTQVGARDDQTQWMMPYAPYSGMIVRFHVRVDGVWTEQSEPIAITVSDSLPAPALTVAESLTLGRDLVVTIGEVEGARDYYIELLDPSGYSVKNLYLDDSGSVAFYGCDLAEGTYTVEAYASSYNMKGTVAKATVTVTAPGTRPSAPAVTAETTEVVMYDPLPFVIDVTGADMVTMRIGDSDVFEPVAVSGNTFRWSDDALWEGWQKYSFAVRVNGVWSPFSEPILVNAVPAAVMAQPVLDMPATLAAGHDLVVNVAALEGAENYDAILTTSDIGWAEDLYMNGTNGATFTFPGYFMTLGTCSVRVNASGYVNDEYVSNNTVVEVSITAGNQPAAPVVTAETEYTLSGSSYAFTIDTTGADKVAVRYMAPDILMPAASHYELTATGDSTTWTHSYSGPDSMRVKYCFSVCVDGVWSPWSETHTVTIVDELPVQPPVITCGESFLAGEDVVFSVEAPEGAASCSWQIVSGESVLEGTFADGYTATLSALEYDMAAGDYLLTVTASLEDGRTTQAEHAFTVTGTRPAGPRITLGKYCVEPGESTTLTVSVPGASKAYIFCRTTGETFLLDVTDGQAVCTFSTDVKCDCYIRAAALYGTQWSAMGSQALLVVEYPLADPVVSVPESIVLGSDLVVSVEPVMHATNCYVEVYTGAGSYIARINADPAGGDFVISGELLTTTGPYKIRVVASNSWYGVESELSTVCVVPD